MQKDQVKIELLKKVYTLIEEKAKQKAIMEQGHEGKDRQGNRKVVIAFYFMKHLDLTKTIKDAKRNFNDLELATINQKLDKPFNLLERINDEFIYRSSKAEHHQPIVSKESKRMVQRIYDLNHLINDLKEGIVIWDSSELLREMVTDLMYWKWLNKGKEAICKEHNLGLGHFRNTWNEIKEPSYRRAALTKNKFQLFQSVIVSLENYPKSKSMASDDLISAQQKTEDKFWLD